MKKVYPPVGTKRVVRRFLLFPKLIGNERRWLEWAWIEQDFVYYMRHTLRSHYWMDMHFVSGPDKEQP